MFNKSTKVVRCIAFRQRHMWFNRLGFGGFNNHLAINVNYSTTKGIVGFALSVTRLRFGNNAPLTKQRLLRVAFWPLPIRYRINIVN